MLSEFYTNITPLVDDVVAEIEAGPHDPFLCHITGSCDGERFWINIPEERAESLAYNILEGIKRTRRAKEQK